MLHDQQRVVITGLGVVCPLGRDLESFWNNLIAGKCGITQLSCLPADSNTVRFGGEAKCFTGDIGDFGPLEKSLQRSIKKNQKVMCREIEMGVAACQLALHHSGLADPATRNPERTGIVFGSDYILTRPEEYADGVKACFDDQEHFQMPLWPGTGRPQVNPLWLLKYLPNMPASHVAIYNDLRGPSNSVTIREASSAASITEAVATIRRGAADVMLAGATGSRLEPLRALHFATSEKNADDSDPAGMSRPFGKHRSGTVLGEGAGGVGSRISRKCKSPWRQDLGRSHWRGRFGGLWRTAQQKRRQHSSCNRQCLARPNEKGSRRRGRFDARSVAYSCMRQKRARARSVGSVGDSRCGGESIPCRDLGERVFWQSGSGFGCN
jgi:hypothetical protein